MAPRPSKLKEKQLNEDGEIINWDSNWEDAVKLRDVLFDGRIDMDATAKAIQEAHPDPFAKHMNKSFTGGLATIKASVKKEKAVLRGTGSNSAFLVFRLLFSVVRLARFVSLGSSRLIAPFSLVPFVRRFALSFTHFSALFHCSCQHHARRNSSHH